MLSWQHMFQLRLLIDAFYGTLPPSRYLQPSTNNMMAPLTVTSTTAKHYAYLANKDDFLNRLVVLPPYQDKGTSPWVRGYLKIKDPQDSRLHDFVFTGPQLRVTYSGCSWNKIVFNLHPTNPTEQHFQQFLVEISKQVNDVIMSSPSKFKPGATNNVRFHWDQEMLVKTSADSSMYTDELKCRLSTYRDGTVSGSMSNSEVDVLTSVDTYFFKRMEDGTQYPILPDEIQGGDYAIPIFRVGYGRNVDRFFLTLTVLKALVIPSVKLPMAKISNEQWEMDDSMEK